MDQCISFFSRYYSQKRHTVVVNTVDSIFTHFWRLFEARLQKMFVFTLVESPPSPTNLAPASKFDVSTNKLNSYISRYSTGEGKIFNIRMTVLLYTLQSIIQENMTLTFFTKRLIISFCHIFYENNSKVHNFNFESIVAQHQSDLAYR